MVLYSNISIFVLLFGIASVTLGAKDTLPPSPKGYEWEPISTLTDEFNGKLLDPSKWQPLLPYWEGHPPSRFAAANVTVSDGNLELRSTSRIKSMGDIGNPETDIWVNAACVSSLRAIASYGYYEARIKASSLPMTSSFWLQGQYSEIDVAEQRGIPVYHVEDALLMHSTAHFYHGAPRVRSSSTIKTNLSSRPNERFYVYGVWWRDRHTVWFYLDGIKIGEVSTPGEFNEAMYLIFDTEVWTKQSGLPSIEALGDHRKNTMLVDWVRAWHLVQKPTK